MFVNHQLFAVCLHQHHEIVKAADPAVELNAIEEENSHWDVLFLNLVEKAVLETKLPVHDARYRKSWFQNKKPELLRWFFYNGIHLLLVEFRTRFSPLT